MVAMLEQHGARVAAIATCLLLALWLSAEGRRQVGVRSASDALSSGDRAGAFRLAREIDSGPAALRARLVEGDALTQLGRHREAGAAYARAIDLSPNDWKLRRSYAVALANSGRLAAGQRQLARAEVLNPRIVIDNQLPTP